MKTIFILLSLLFLAACASTHSFHPVATQPIQIEMEARVYFPFNSDRFDESQWSTIKKEAELLGQHKGIKIIVEGHTDSIGASAYNKELGDRRARQVLVELIRAGVDSTQLIVVSAGEERPTTSNTTAQGRAENRRVAFVVRR